MIASDRNRFGRAGARIHDPSHPAWRQDVEIIVGQAGSRLAYITVPKATHHEQVAEVIAFIRETAQRAGLERPVPVHVLIETTARCATCSRSPNCRTSRCWTSA
jgi:citrate lyase subunit beta/citryl-CoA lyase